MTTQNTHPFNGPFSATTQVSRYQKGKTNLDFTEARDSEWHWHQLGRMQVCTLLQTDNHASTPPLSFLQTGCPSCRPTNRTEIIFATKFRREKTRLTAPHTNSKSLFSFLRQLTTWRCPHPAAARRAAARLLLTAGPQSTGRAAVDRISPDRRAHSSKPGNRTGQTNRQTDARQLHRLCSAGTDNEDMSDDQLSSLDNVHNDPTTSRTH